MISARRFAITAILFEGGLGIAALGLGALFGIDPLVTFRESSGWSRVCIGVLIGLVAAVPLARLLVTFDRRPGPFRHFKDYIERHLVPIFRELSVLEVAIISLAAGIGEEMLFRGLIQEGLAQWIGQPLGVAAGLIVASIAFGCCHWLNSTYAALAALIGIYLGVLMIVSGQLLAPVVTHAAYDFFAILYISRSAPPVSRFEQHPPVWSNREPPVEQDSASGDDEES